MAFPCIQKHTLRKRDCGNTPSTCLEFGSSFSHFRYFCGSEILIKKPFTFALFAAKHKKF